MKSYFYIALQCATFGLICWIGKPDFQLILDSPTLTMVINTFIFYFSVRAVWIMVYLVWFFVTGIVVDILKYDEYFVTQSDLMVYLGILLPAGLMINIMTQFNLYKMIPIYPQFSFAQVLLIVGVVATLHLAFEFNERVELVRPV